MWPQNAVNYSKYAQRYCTLSHRWPQNAVKCSKYAQRYCKLSHLWPQNAVKYSKYAQRYCKLSHLWPQNAERANIKPTVAPECCKVLQKCDTPQNEGAETQ